MVRDQSNLDLIQSKLSSVLEEDKENSPFESSNHTKLNRLIYENCVDGFSTANELIDNYQSTFKTGILSLDKLLSTSRSGIQGIIPGQTYEIAGKSRTGKTQFCHQISLMIQMNKQNGGLEKKVIYIDTEKNFSPSRLLDLMHGIQMKHGKCLKFKTILENIKIAQPTSSQQLINTVVKVVDELVKHPSEYGLIIVDTITGLFRSEYDISTLQTRQGKILKLLNLLGTIARIFNIAVVVTNQVKSTHDKFDNEKTIPVGGHVIAHWANHRMMMKYLNRNRREIEIINSHSYPMDKCMFYITTDGLVSEN